MEQEDKSFLYNQKVFILDRGEIKKGTYAEQWDWEQSYVRIEGDLEETAIDDRYIFSSIDDIYNYLLERLVVRINNNKKQLETIPLEIKEQEKELEEMKNIKYWRINERIKQFK